ncbi:MAG: helix-turn-helix domain-containing protein [Ktedonobacteraceae bacterium]|jgi:excisionase family DNA binding protein
MSTEWLTVESIARELAINIDTVRSWIRQKKLKAYKVGRDYRIKREDYNKFLEERANIQDNKDKE